MLIDVEIPADRNANKKEAKNFLINLYLAIEIQCMWNVKEKVFPLITGRRELSQNHSKKT
jgi:hypothetical protein